MNREIVNRLIELNRDFYSHFADSFADSRSQPQPGFSSLLPFLPKPCHRFLDVGCGEGRLGRFLLANRAIDEYVGIDFTQALVEKAQNSTGQKCYLRHLVQANSLSGLGRFDAIACLATLQHIPGRFNRLNLLTEMVRVLVEDGRIILSNWQFATNKRQRKKILDWSVVGLDVADLEKNDYLLSWQRGGLGLRYVSYINQQEIESLLDQANLDVVTHFRADGKESNLNLYTIALHRRVNRGEV